MDLKVHQKHWNLVEGQFVEIPMTADGGGHGFPSIKIVREDRSKESVITNNTDPGRIILLQTKAGQFYLLLLFHFTNVKYYPIRMHKCEHVRWFRLEPKEIKLLISMSPKFNFINTGKIYTNHIMKISCFLEKKS